MKRKFLMFSLALLVFALYNMFRFYFTNDGQVNEPYPLYELGMHLPFVHKFAAAAIYFQDEALYFDQYWMTWSISFWLALASISIFGFKHAKKIMIKRQ